MKNDKTTLQAHLVIQNGGIPAALLQTCQHVSYVIVHVSHDGNERPVFLLLGPLVLEAVPHADLANVFAHDILQVGHGHAALPAAHQGRQHPYLLAAIRQNILRLRAQDVKLRAKLSEGDVGVALEGFGDAHDDVVVEIVGGREGPRVGDGRVGGRGEGAEDGGFGVRHDVLIWK